MQIFRTKFQLFLIRYCIIHFFVLSLHQLKQLKIKTMANFVLEVVFEEGRTDCDNCPFRTDNGCCDIPTEHKLDCDKYDLTTITLRKNIGEIKLNF